MFSIINPATQAEIDAAGLMPNLTFQLQELECMLKASRQHHARHALAAFRTDFPSNHMLDTLGQHLDYDVVARSGGAIATAGRFILRNQVVRDSTYWGLDIILFWENINANEAFQRLPSPRSWGRIRLGRSPLTAAEGYPFRLELTRD